MKIYVVTRKTEDSEFNQISSFYSLHLTPESADNAIKQYVRDFGYEEQEFEILERKAN